MVQPPPNIPVPPFCGVRVRKDFDLREVFQYINETALFKNQWQLKTASQEDYLRLVEEKYRPDLRAAKRSDCQGLVRAESRVWILWRKAEGNDYVFDPPETRQRDCSGLLFRGSAKDASFRIADFFVPKVSGKMDVIGLSVVTIGAGLGGDARSCSRPASIPSISTCTV